MPQINLKDGVKTVTLTRTEWKRLKAAESLLKDLASTDDQDASAALELLSPLIDRFDAKKE